MINYICSLKSILSLLIGAMIVATGVSIPISVHATKNPIDQVTDASSQKKVKIRQVKFLESYVRRYPNNSQAWEALAKMQENIGQITPAIATWQYIGKHFNRMPEAIVNQAKLLWQNNQPEKAFSMLLSNQNNVTEKDSSFWEILGDISWELKEAENALSAYSILWKSDGTNVLAAERLILLKRDIGQAEESIKIGEEAYHRLNQPRWLLLSMDVANQAGLLTQLKRLIKIAISNESQFKDLEMYWLIRAQSEIHEQKPKIAINHYHQALLGPVNTI
ncbi:tetratricopeptide repeat protein [Nitrosomonas ureae]|uniref:Tetratricopeptide repeat-containing protein n=1 Tax=Nitrosomonas ureae TaxID=44577 RepID=A0A1H5YFU4_9PROT|nr:tetratricopeptide repeat protein [Nitrosomonas ureae]SEG22582.1 Tetratricopeptide repeat-containing protein [Nitrosomonas ureae]